eukprot:s734_g7.t1
MDMYLALTGLLSDDEDQPLTDVKQEPDETAPAQKPKRETTRQDTRKNAYDEQEEFWVTVEDLPDVSSGLTNFARIAAYAEDEKPADAETLKCCSGLEGEVKSMEQQYDKCCELKARADAQGMDEELYKKMEERIKEVTIVLASRIYGDENQEQQTAKKFYEKHDKKEKPDTDSRNPKAKSAVKTGSESAKPKGGAKRSKAKSS